MRQVRMARTHFHFGISARAQVGRWQRLKEQEVETHLRGSQAEAAKQARSRLIRVVMHDLRSPLLAVSNVAETLGDLGSEVSMGDRRVTTGLEALRTCTTLIENIVADLLDFERIDSGRMVLVKRSFSIDALLRDTRLAFVPLVAKKGIRLEMGEVPASVAGSFYMGDARRLLQCLSNGISNAAKFTDSGGVIKINAWTTPHADERWQRVHLAVIDSGMGLTKEELKKLSEGGVFTQVGKGQLQGRGGTGLGLNIVRHILDLHDRSVLSIHSKGEGKGTTFEMQLNLEVATAAGSAVAGAGNSYRVVEAAAGRHMGRQLSHDATTSGSRESSTLVRASSTGKSRTSSPPCTSSYSAAQGPDAVHEMVEEDSADEEEDSAGERMRSRGREVSLLQSDGSETPARREGRPCRCLHVEDDMMLQLTFQARLFDRLGVDYDTAENGKIAVDLMDKAEREGKPYTLVIMDNQMPVLTGTEAGALMRKKGYKGLIIGVTGDPEGSLERENFLESGGLDECVDKSLMAMHILEEYILSQKGGKPDPDHPLPQTGLRVSYGRLESSGDGRRHSAAGQSPLEVEQGVRNSNRLRGAADRNSVGSRRRSSGIAANRLSIGSTQSFSKDDLA